MSPLLAQSLTAFFCTLVAIVALAPLATKVGLVDVPTERKQHQHAVPLIGGLAIFIAFLAGALLWGAADTSAVVIKGQSALGVLMGCSAFLVVTGMLDDRFHLGVFMRIASEILVALAIIELLDLRLNGLGDLVGTGEIGMPPTVSYIFTVVAMFGLMNAFNMLDGIDGLLASLVITTIGGFHLFIAIKPGLISLFILASLSAFLISNLKLSPIVPKSFLGDAGSKLLGFVVVCLLLGAASGQVGGPKLIKPATALFLVAVPLFDMVFTTLRRVIRKGSPFAADRSHIHHLFLDLGFSHRRALVIIVTLNLAATSLGLLLHRLNAPEYYQLGIFIGMFATYCLLASQAWIVAGRLQSAPSAAPDGSDPTSSEQASPTGAQTARLDNAVTPLRR
jgi:UDP-GlcNAc:undecaprenyl-phosphate GlcNAc-1-phosphate transferase